MPYALLAFVLLATPTLALAGESLQTLTVRATVFIGTVLIQFLLAIALLVFLWNAFKYFIAGGANQEERAKARTLAFYSICAFVIIIVMWAIVNAIVSGLGIGLNEAPSPDYGPGYDPSAPAPTSDCLNSPRPC